MESGGGVLPAEEAAFQAANLLTSGPAGGVLASQKLGEQLGYRNIITTDMGGTSFDVGLIVDGQPILETHARGRTLPCGAAVDQGDGDRRRRRLDRARHATATSPSGRKAPGRSQGRLATAAAARSPTITDADIVLGIIDPAYFLGGQMKLSIEKSKAAIEQKIAKPLGLDISRSRGGHPRSRQQPDGRPVAPGDARVRAMTRATSCIFAYGGAGPTHAHPYGSIGGIATVVVPTTASGHSALGSVTADRHRSFSYSFGQHAPPRFKRASDHVDAAALNAGFEALEKRCHDALGKDCLIQRLVAMRFRLQVHEVPIEVPQKTLTAADLDDLVDRVRAEIRAHLRRRAVRCAVRVSSSRCCAPRRCRPCPSRSRPRRRRRSAIRGRCSAGVSISTAQAS